MPANIRVLGIGSCRIFRPLRRLHKRDKLELVNYPENYWFTHSSIAARQYLEVLHGDLRIPEVLRSYALETVLDWRGDMAVGIPEADIAVIEVSSLKSFEVSGIALNAHKVAGGLKSLGVDYRAGLRGDVRAVPSDHALSMLTLRETRFDDLVEDLSAIQTFLGIPVVTVDHLYASTPEGGPAAARARLTSELALVESTAGIPFHSTRTAIERAGENVALLDQNHYASDFEVDAGLSLLSTLRATLTGHSKEW